MLLCLGIVAEYIWRIYEEVKGRPGFIIRQEELNEPTLPISQLPRTNGQKSIKSS
jgi:hypothetical protein